MSRYIDAELAKETMREYLNTEAPMPEICKKVMDIAIGAVDLTPTADVAEVVRCKDCKWWECYEDRYGIGKCQNPTNGLFSAYSDNEDYCSYGERKENGT